MFGDVGCGVDVGDYQTMPGGIQQSTVSGCQGLFQTQKKFLEKNVDEVTETLSNRN